MYVIETKSSNMLALTY